MRDQAPGVFGVTAPLDVPHDVPSPMEESPPEDAAPVRVETVPGAQPYDPLRLCIYTTIALIAWLITPPLTMAVFGTIGVVGYVRARRRGLVASRCFLGDTRIVIAYLGVLAATGAGFTLWRLLS